MKPQRIIVLAVGLVLGVVALYMFMNQQTPEPSEPPPSGPIVAPTPVDEVLVTQTKIEVGSALTLENLKWKALSSEIVPEGAILKSKQSDALEKYVGKMVRTTMLAEQPINESYLVLSGGYMATVLPQGKRAIAILIDNRGGNSAGNFIMPNDHVDIIKVSSGNEIQGGNGTGAEIILQNIRVMAIGDVIEKNTQDKTSVGSTATIEVTPLEAEIIAAAQKNSQLVLALRSYEDKNAKQQVIRDTFTVIRFGQPQTSLR